MPPKPFKQSLKYNPLLLPNEHKEAIQHINYELWNELAIINNNFPRVEITVNHLIRDFGKTYAVDLELSCKDKEIQAMLDDCYERQMRLIKFSKHDFFDAMIIDQ
jgi:hypothetical protein